MWRITQKRYQKCVKLHIFPTSRKNKDMFNRTIIHELEQWKERRDRKPLMMLGARQVGKTSVLKKFGKTALSIVLISVLMKKRVFVISFARPRTCCKSSSSCRILHPSQSCLKRLCLSLMRYRIVRKPLVP